MLNIPSYRQTPGLCGSACLKMVLAYFGVEKNEKELAKLAGATKNKGATAAGLTRAAEKLGFKSLIKDNASLADIQHYVLKKKIPVMVDWFSKDDGHYSVVVDMDDKNIYLRDPERDDLNVLDLQTFYRVWFDFPGDYLKIKNDLILRRLIVISH